MYYRNDMQPIIQQWIASIYFTNRYWLVLKGIQWNTSHYSAVIISAMASQITGISNICLTVCSVAHQRKHQSSTSLAFVKGIHRWSADSPHKRQVTRKIFPFDDTILSLHLCLNNVICTIERIWKWNCKATTFFREQWGKVINNSYLAEIELKVFRMLHNSFDQT